MSKILVRAAFRGANVAIPTRKNQEELMKYKQIFPAIFNSSGLSFESTVSEDKLVKATSTVFPAQSHVETLLV